MKTNLISLTACLAIIGSLTISCNSCDHKNNDPLPGATPPEVSSDESANMELSSDGTTTSGTMTSGTSDNQNSHRSAGNSVTYGNHGATAGSPSTMGTAVNKARDAGSGKTKSKASKSGYSAPNGTDAENHDGDPYTKNDTTSMPTGTSIR